MGPELTARVRAAMEALDYRPSRIARSMVTGRTGTLGVLHAPMSYDIWGRTFVQAVVNGIAAEAQLLRQDILIYTNALTDEPVRALADVDDARVSGLVVIAPSDDHHLVDMLAERKFPMVIICGVPREGVPFLHCDSSEGMKQAFTHLVSLGHRRIGCISGNKSHKSAADRLRLYHNYMADFGLSVDPHWVVDGNFDPDRAYVGARAILSSRNRPTAILVSNDQMAARVIDCANDFGLSVPDHLSVIGFDDTVIAQTLHPQLTTISQPLDTLGAAAVHVLKGKVDGKPVPSISSFSTSLIIRNSTTRPMEDIQCIVKHLH